MKWIGQKWLPENGSKGAPESPVPQARDATVDNLWDGMTTSELRLRLGAVEEQRLATKRNNLVWKIAGPIIGGVIVAALFWVGGAIRDKAISQIVAGTASASDLQTHTAKNEMQFAAIERRLDAVQKVGIDTRKLARKLCRRTHGCNPDTDEE